MGRIVQDLTTEGIMDLLLKDKWAFNDFHHAWREAHPIERLHLVGAKLDSADLQGACLRGCDLSNASLWRANLRNADLQWARLCGANLHKADVDETYLQDADLEGASLGSSIGTPYADTKNTEYIIAQRSAYLRYRATAPTPPRS